MLYIIASSASSFLQRYCPLHPQQAQKLEQIIAEAKKEGEVTLVASASTFGGKKGFAELEKRFRQAIRLQGQGQSHRRPELSASGGAHHHRAKSRRQIVDRLVPGLRRHLCDDGITRRRCRRSTGRESFPG